MAATRGLVVHTSPNGWADVVVDRKSACGGCADTQKCRSCLSGPKITARVLNRAKAANGDLVVVSLESKIVFKGAAVAYLIPIVGLMVGAFFGSAIHAKWGITETTASLLMGILGLAGGFGASTFISRRITAKKKFTPVISRVVNVIPNR